MSKNLEMGWLMLNHLTIPDAKVRAMINGKYISTPRALAVFEQAAKLIICKYTLVDSGLSKGTLVTEKAVEALYKAIPSLLHNDEVPLEFVEKSEVIAFYKTADWKKARHLPVWCSESARLFMDCCIRTCSGIDLA